VKPFRRWLTSDGGFLRATDPDDTSDEDCADGTGPGFSTVPTTSRSDAYVCVCVSNQVYAYYVHYYGGSVGDIRRAHPSVYAFGGATGLLGRRSSARTGQAQRVAQQRRPRATGLAPLSTRGVVNNNNNNNNDNNTYGLTHAHTLTRTLPPLSTKNWSSGAHRCRRRARDSCFRMWHVRTRGPPFNGRKRRYDPNILTIFKRSLCFLCNPHLTSAPELQ